MNNIITHIDKGNIFHLMKNDLMAQGLLRGEEWEPHITKLIETQLDSNSVFIDIGSNFGYHTVFASKICKRVYSFEPQTEVFHLLERSKESNKCGNVITYNCALGNANKMVKLHPVDYTATSNFGDVGIGNRESNLVTILKSIIKSAIGYSRNDNKGQNIEMKQLDSFGLENIDLIKLDVQGYEIFVLQGAEKLLEKCRPLLIVEFEDFQLKKFGYDSSVLFNHIKNIGYYPMFLDYKYPSDHVCIPNEKLEKFRKKNNRFISSLKENNALNNNLLHGVTEKICFLSS